MATYKVYKKGNYIIVEDSANKYWEEIALNTKISKEFVDSTSYTITFKDVKETWTMPFADIKKADGTAYTDVATWENWYTANTGFNAATTESVAAVVTSLSGKQDVLVSGDSIKTINGASILGSGNLVISGGGGGGAGDMVMSTYDTDGDGVVDRAETIPITVRNNSSSLILRKGTIVYLSGSTGSRPNAVRAQANSELTSSGTFGIVMSDIGTNSDGLVCAMGTLHDLDTRNTAPNPFTADVLVDGDVLWLDPNNAGYVTKTKPQAPNHIVFIGIVARTSPTLGRVIIRISNGFELEELHNVFINGTLADKHSLYYDAATSLWKTNTIASIIGYTPANKAGETFTGNISATNLSGTNTGDQDLSGLVVKNAAITGATKTKVTYDAKGLVTAGADATTADIADSTNKRYVTEVEKTNINYLNTVASNVQDQINAKVNLNTLITAGTGTKVTYDTKGLILSSTSATTADIADSTNKRYVTDTNLVVIGNTSGTNTGDNAANTLYSGLAASKQDVITLTTTGTSGAATLVSGTLNIPQYSGGSGTVPQSITNSSLIFYSNNC